MTAPDQVVVTSGAKSGLLALFAALLEAGDELIHPRPCYPAYPAMAARLGARPVAVAERGGGFAGWSEAVADAIGPRTRAVVLASPSNPTGTTLETTEAEALVALCRNRGIRLICDEAYVDFRFASDRQALAAVFDPERITVVQVRSASKSWAVCGWRIGWVTGDASLVARVARTHASFINPASGPAQSALCALPEIPDDYLENARSQVARRVEELCSALETAGIPITRPEGGFYLWLDVADRIEAAGASDAVRWCVEIARQSGIGLWPGEDFGGTGHVRIAVTAPSDPDWQNAMEALINALS
jgi:aspartate/methionine/tyrosine aminotransferase